MKSVDIELTPCTTETVEAYARLASAAFHFATATPPGWRVAISEDPRCGLDRYFLARVGGDVVGGFRILPLEMKVSERPDGWVQVGGLGRLGVYPHYRSLGYAGGVMRLVLQRSHQQGDVLSLVYPTSFEFCRRHGYSIAARHLLYGVPPRAFPDHPLREHVRPAHPDDWEGINRCYEHQLPQSLGILRRSEEVWREYYLGRTVEEGFGHYVYDNGNGIQAYISLRYDAAGTSYYQQEVHVAEWFACTAEAERACLGFFRAQSANIELVKLPTPPNCALDAGLVEPVWPEDPDREPWQQPIAKLCSTLMGRIIRVHEAMAARAFASDGRVNLLIEDWALPENSGYWSLVVEGGRGELAPASEGDPDVRLDIGILSSLYTGALSASQALRYGLLEATEGTAAQLDHMLGRNCFVVWDYF